MLMLKPGKMTLKFLLGRWRWLLLLNFHLLFLLRLQCVNSFLVTQQYWNRNGSCKATDKVPTRDHYLNAFQGDNDDNDDDDDYYGYDDFTKTCKTHTFHSNIIRTVTSLKKQDVMEHHPLAEKISSILLRWSQEWKENEEKDAWGLLNKPNLLHEVEESMIVLELLIKWMDEQQEQQQQQKEQHTTTTTTTTTKNNNNFPMVIVDVCCGKGIFSMLASYIFQNDSRVSKIIMIDKDPNVNWSHVNVANKDAEQSKRPIIETRQCNLFEMDEMTQWLSTTTYDDYKLGLVGIHLCKNLSPTLIGIANSLGPSKAPFLCLAPCCLPRVVLQSRYPKQQQEQILEVASYESEMARQARLVTIQRRKNAKQRKTPCLLCESIHHKIQNCPQLPSSRKSQLELFERAAALEPCWKCGELGHTKKDCPLNEQQQQQQQSSSLPAIMSRPLRKLNVSHILSSHDPFQTYCNELCTVIERENIDLVESKLESTKSSHQEHQNNWNRERKTLYIVATSSLSVVNNK